MRRVTQIPRSVWLGMAWIMASGGFTWLTWQGGRPLLWASLIWPVAAAGYWAGWLWALGLVAAANILGTMMRMGLGPSAAGILDVAVGSALIPAAMVVATLRSQQRQCAWEHRQVQEASRLRELERHRDAMHQEHRELEREVIQLGNLYELTTQLLLSHDRHDAAKALAEALTGALPRAAFRLCFLDAESSPEPALEDVYLLESQGVGRRKSIEAEEWLLQHLLRQPVLWSALPMVGTAHAPPDTPDELRHATAFPFVTQGTLQGFLIADQLTQDAIERCGILVSQFALAVRRIRLYERVQELAIRDGLTGLFVRRHFVMRLQEEVARAARHDQPLAFLMVDIDHFKGINDTYGHLVGDAVLRELSALLRTQVRDVDLLGRYGGEEFGVALLGSGLVQAQAAAERIRYAVAEMVFRTYDERLTVTISIGVAVFPADAADAAELVERADHAMYRAKLAGRNRVCTSEP